jgi:hypothetical protein
MRKGCLWTAFSFLGEQKRFDISDYFWQIYPLFKGVIRCQKYAMFAVKNRSMGIM